MKWSNANPPRGHQCPCIIRRSSIFHWSVNSYLLPVFYWWGNITYNFCKSQDFPYEIVNVSIFGILLTIRSDLSLFANISFWLKSRDREKKSSAGGISFEKTLVFQAKLSFIWSGTWLSPKENILISEGKHGYVRGKMLLCPKENNVMFPRKLHFRWISPRFSFYFERLFSVIRL